jgi:Na+/proline symporter
MHATSSSFYIQDFFFLCCSYSLPFLSYFYQANAHLRVWSRHKKKAIEAVARDISPFFFFFFFLFFFLFFSLYGINYPKEEEKKLSMK